MAARADRSLPARWLTEDQDLFRRVDPTSYFHDLQFLDFADAVRTGRAPAIDGREARKSVALVEAIYLSGRERRPVCRLPQGRRRRRGDVGPRSSP